MLLGAKKAPRSPTRGDRDPMKEKEHTPSPENICHPQIIRGVVDVPKNHPDDGQGEYRGVQREKTASKNP